MDAEITIKFKMKDVCSKDYLDMAGISLDHMVRYIIDEEGIRGIIPDKIEIFDIKEVINGK
jgi:hypothetical protein